MKKSFASLLIMISIVCFMRIGFAATYNEHNYWIIEVPSISWDNAQAAAIAAGGYLATITDGDEQTFIETILPATGELWLGGYQTEPSSDPNANWAWITGETWNYTNWNSGEPNDNYGYASEESLAILCDLEKWNDEGSLNNISGYIIESPVPIPPALILLGSGLLILARFRRKFER